MKRRPTTLVILAFIACALPFFGAAQNFTIESGKKSVSFPFSLVHNLIIIPVSINGSDTLRFILDTGVKSTLILENSDMRAIKLQNAREVTVSGLGGGDPIQAVLSTGNSISLPKGISAGGQQIVSMLSQDFSLSENMGFPVHGLIGYELLKDFVVDVDYVHKTLTLHKPEKYKSPKNKQIIPLAFEHDKPYINTFVDSKGCQLPVKLIVDSGASHALCLYSKAESGINLPDKHFKDCLGKGISGDVTGCVGKIEGFHLGTYCMPQPVTAFPDKESTKHVGDVANRNGSLGADILRRFDLTIDYPNSRLLIKPNKEFKKPFRYNVCGAEIGSPVPGMPIYMVNKIRQDSPAMYAGLLQGDQLLEINGLNTAAMSLNDIVNYMEGTSGKKLRLTIMRNEKQLKKQVYLKDDI